MFATIQAYIHTMLPTVSATGIFTSLAFLCKVTPPSALHALDRFLLLLLQSNQAAINAKAIFDQFVGDIN
jgi:hypothetical protein